MVMLNSLFRIKRIPFEYLISSILGNSIIFNLFIFAVSHCYDFYLYDCRYHRLICRSLSLIINYVSQKLSSEKEERFLTKREKEIKTSERNSDLIIFNSLESL